MSENLVFLLTPAASHLAVGVLQDPVKSLLGVVTGDIHTHFMLRLISCGEVRKEPGFFFLALSGFPGNYKYITTCRVFQQYCTQPKLYDKAFKCGHSRSSKLTLTGN